MASSSDEGTVCNRKRKHEQHDGCSMPNTIPLHVEKDPVTIGRLEDATVRLQCSLIPSMISRKHATIVYSRLKRKWSIKDHKSCNGVYLNGKKVDPDKWYEIKVKDRLCFGTPISNNSFRYIFEQLTNDDYQLVQEELIADKELPGGTKKKPSEVGVADASETGAVVIKEELTSDGKKANPADDASGQSPVDDKRRNEMLSSMQEEFLCVICQELFVKAHSLSCSHSYCGKCITDWIKKGNKYCPMCRKTIEGKPVPSIAMDNAIGKIVECLPEDVQKERTELLKERSSQNQDVILISDSPVRSGPSSAITRSGMITRSIARRTINVIESSDSNSELSDSQSDDDPERYDDGYEEYEDFYLPGYNGLPGHSWGGYGHCYRCGDPGHWAPGCPN